MRLNLLSFIAAILFAGATFAAEPIPIILDTDIGSDVDDAYALALAATHPRLDLRAVTTVYGKPDVRAAIARKLLVLLGREDVPVAAGRARAADGHDPFWGGWEGKGLLEEGEKVEGVSDKPAAELMAEVLRASPGKVTIVPVGGLSNVADLLQASPELKPKIERLVIMGGCVRPITIEGVEVPARFETNLHNDVDAAAAVLSSGLPITLVPAETTFKTKLLRPDFERIQATDTAFARGMAAMTLVFEPLIKGFMSSAGVKTYYDDGVVLLHDPLAVYSIAAPTAMETERVKIRLETSPPATGAASATIRTIADDRGDISVDLVIEPDLTQLSQAVTAAVLNRP